MKPTNNDPEDERRQEYETSEPKSVFETI
jgi:hypothetical protein